MASKRKSKAKSKSEPATKRRKLVTGAKTADDDRLLTGPQTWSRAPSSSAWSTRVLPSEHVSPLTTLCLGVFAKNLGRLAKKDETFDAIRAWLKLLPDTVVPRLFAMLRSTCPTILSHAFIVAVCDYAYLHIRFPNGLVSTYCAGIRSFLLENL